ncbi:uncharacterized protein I303_102366 [Kwoniella dejecticola CBS 10117]|uniref:Putative peptidase domain-containing protein n=1 Tax=Kwoniella dejecticola CBS 10117 TaxID=1296121 RepID=A0A1A6AB56_9TREE|nr:uncharacterized protein I303_01494 [Kwoniella dejecticola CBS 10117]OBR87292.1 hypothetical protein I303_01494 [Kwoniella dejecticola CBS 10117]
MFAQLTSAAILALPLLASVNASPVVQRDSSSASDESTTSSDLLSAFEPNTTAWKDGASDSFSVWGNSCNTTQLELIGEGLAQTFKLVEHGRDHLRRFGNDSFFQRWFGNDNNPLILEGLYDRIVSGDKGNVSFTCDDVDSLCNGKYGIIPGYFSPSTPELTVVCPTYYLSKGPLAELCTNGETIASQGSESTDGSWFLHRLLHLPQTTGGGLSDVVDSAHDAVDLAQGVNATQAIKNIHSIQYYALDVYASDILLPGEGCLGDTSVEVADKE